MEAPRGEKGSFKGAVGKGAWKEDSSLSKRRATGTCSPRTGEKVVQTDEAHLKSCPWEGRRIKGETGKHERGSNRGDSPRPVG